MKTVIYYFSGTGNSLKVARDLAAKIEDAAILSIPEALKNGMDNTASRIGIVFPVYAWGMPAIVKKFVGRLPADSSKYYFALCTCAGCPGGTLQNLSNYMKSKGLMLSSGFSVIMPTNYIVWSDAISEEKQKELFLKWDNRVDEIAGIIEKNETRRVEKNSPPLNLLLTGILYKLSLPNFPKMDKAFWTDGKCNSCEICEKLCPVGNIKLAEGKPSWQHNCEQCLACIQWCPQKAVQYGKNTKSRNRYTNPGVSLKEML